MLNLFLKSFNFVNLHIIIKNEFMLLLYNNVFMYMKNISCYFTTEKYLLRSFYFTTKIYITWFSVHFAPIFYFNCKHFLFVKQQIKKFTDFIKKSRGYKSNFARGYFEIFIIYKPSLGHARPPTTFGAIGSVVSTFIGYKQTRRQTKFIIYRYVQCFI